MLVAEIVGENLGLYRRDPFPSIILLGSANLLEDRIRRAISPGQHRAQQALGRLIGADAVATTARVFSEVSKYCLNDGRVDFAQARHRARNCADFILVQVIHEFRDLPLLQTEKQNGGTLRAA